MHGSWKNSSNSEQETIDLKRSAPDNRNDWTQYEKLKACIAILSNENKNQIPLVFPLTSRC